MSGPTSFLQRDRRVVLDTNVLVNAASDHEGAAPSLYADLARAILGRCAKVVWGPAQANQAIIHLTHAGFRHFDKRFPVQIKLFRDLDEHKDRKLIRVEASKIKPFSDEERKHFRAPGHQDVSDDASICEVARSASAVVITNDPYLLDRSRALLNGVGVTICGVHEALEDDPPT